MPPSFHIIDLKQGDETLLRQAAELLVAGFHEHWPEAWPDLGAALEEVQQAVKQGHICRAALDGDGRLLGWTGAIPTYATTGWELHPLVVSSTAQGQGIGRALVLDLEEQVRQRGGITLYLGTDDTDNMTTLSGVDLYDDLPGRIARVRNLRRHPYEFYQRLGYTIVGVIPDANGPGKPDILMAKRV
jgi:aminoglycoside 6'-N-acetyltransferase I